MKFNGLPDLSVLSAARILKNVKIQKPCFGATLVALPTALNAASAAWLATIIL